MLMLVALTGQTSNPGAPLLRLLRLNRDDEAAGALAVGRPITAMTAVSGVVKQAQRRLTPEQQHELVRRYEAGAQMSYLAQHYGVHRSTVSAILKRHAVSTRQSGLSAE